MRICFCLRGLAVLCAVLLLFSCLSTPGLAENVLTQAPLSTGTVSHSGTVRVYLASLGNPTSLTLTPNCGYTAMGSQEVTLQSGQQVSISFSRSSGQITMNAGGQSYAMGRTLNLKRHAAEHGYGMKIAQSRISSNIYPGDLMLTAKQSGSAWRLYPVMHVGMEDYLTGVVPYEMGNSAPLESLKAQAVAARTYTINRMNQRKNYLYDIVDTTSDQVYNGNNSGTARCTEAVMSTSGLVLHYGGKPIIAYYSASNGGQTESAKNAWGSVGYDYLTVRDDPFDRSNTAAVVKRATVYADNTVSGQNARLRNLLQTKAKTALKAQGVSTDSVNVIAIRSMTPHTPKYASPSVLYTKMDFGVTAVANGQEYSLTLTCDIFSELEAILGLSINSSKNELWSVTPTSTSFIIEARRFGHGIGMSQRGAMAMGQQGYSYDQILGFYYVGCELVRYDFGGALGPAELPGGSATATVRSNEQGLRLALLDAPYANGRVLTGLLPGTLLKVIQQRDDFSLVSYGQLTGYAATDSLQISGEPTGETYTISTISQWATVVCDGVLNLRTAASLQSGVQTTIPNGEVLCVLRVEDGWAQVIYGALTGYVSTDFLTLHAEYPMPVYLGAETAATTPGTVETPTETPAPVVPIPPDIVPGGDTGTATPTPAPMLPPSMTPVPEQADWAMVATEYGSLNLRIRPGRGEKVLRRIPKGEVIPVLKRGGGWIKTSYNGKIGYVQERFLALSPELTPPSVTPKAEEALWRGWVVTDTGSLNLRKKASSSAALVDRIPMGAVVSVLEETGDWCYITYDGKRGYVQTRFLSRTPPTGPVYDETLMPSEDIGATVRENEMILRSWCAENAPERARVPGGAWVQVMERGETWCRISYEGWEGYARTDELYLMEN